MDYAFQLFVYTIAAFGLAYIVGHAEITLGWRTKWAHSVRALDEYRCNVCVKANPIDDEKTFHWLASEVIDHHGKIECPEGGEAHDAGFVLLRHADDPFLLRLLECPACFGFWIGVMASPLFYPQSLQVAILLPLYTAGANYMLGRLTGIVPHPNEET